MKGINRVVIGGNVGQRLVFGETKSNKIPSCSFDVCIDDGKKIVWIAVNAYGQGMVEKCRRFVQKGRYVIINGELMSRAVKDMQKIEVKATDILVVEPAFKREEELTNKSEEQVAN